MDDNYQTVIRVCCGAGGTWRFLCVTCGVLVVSGSAERVGGLRQLPGRFMVKFVNGL